MGKPKHRLSDVEVRTAKPPSVLNDGAGLFYRPSAEGVGAWSFRFTSSDPAYIARQTASGSKNRQREMGLGRYPNVKLKSARAIAERAQEIVAHGQDPIEVAKRDAADALKAAEAARKAESEQAMTFGRYADEIFLPEILLRFKNAAHIQQWQATFKTHAAGLRNKPLASINRKDVLAVLKPIWETKNVTASRSRERIERLFSHATQNEYFDRDNPAAWKQHNERLSSPRKLTRGHHASIPPAGIPAFVAAIRAKQSDSSAALMLEWIVLSACRTGEARFAVWSEIDLDRSLWSIPAERMKMKRGHVVPITARMAEVLAEAKRRRLTPPEPTDYVFCNPNGASLSEMAALMLLRRMEAYKGFTVHGLRASFRTWAGTHTEFPRELLEEQLAHQLGPVEQAYVREAAAERRRVVMEAWAAVCLGEKPAPLDNVVRMRA